MKRHKGTARRRRKMKQFEEKVSLFMQGGLSQMMSIFGLLGLTVG
jgi:hypothetical protein